MAFTMCFELRWAGYGGGVWVAPYIYLWMPHKALRGALPTKDIILLAPNTPSPPIESQALATFQPYVIYDLSSHQRENS